MAREAAERDPQGAAHLIELAGGEIDGIDAQTTFAAAESGNAVAEAVIDQVINNVARGLANLLATLDPDGIMVGGGVVNSLQDRWDELIDRVRKYALPRYVERGVPVFRPPS